MKRTFAGIIFIAGWLISCDRTNNDPGYDYFPDMFYSRAYETFAENPVFADGKTLREPVAGTIPTDIIPYPYTKTDADRLLAGKDLVNPFAADDANLAMGSRDYGIFCMQCHGAQADGNGLLYRNGLYNFKPASLVNDKMKAAPDGEIYHVISVGQGVMQEHGSIIRPDDRWKIVLYLRKLQSEHISGTTESSVTIN
jgi:mono/diheme cytochrome c family protein